VGFSSAVGSVEEEEDTKRGELKRTNRKKDQTEWKDKQTTHVAAQLLGND
jgi:hypothetical protein